MARPKKRKLDLNNDEDYAEHIRQLNQVEAEERPVGNTGRRTPVPPDYYED